MSHVVAELTLVPEEALARASDDALAHTIGVLVAEQKARALASGDLAAIVDHAFETWAFTRAGRPELPRLIGGLLVCPGYKHEKSAASHDCGFVSVDGAWVWEHPEVAFDEMRTTSGVKPVRQSITVLPAFEGMVFDVVLSSARSGPCRMKEATSFIVTGGVLVETSRRIRPPDTHR